MFRPSRVWPRLTVLTGLMVLAGCAYSPDRLPTLERQFYDNLTTQEQQSEFLALRSSERQAFLEQHGLWERWTELSSEEREAVAARTVKVGYKEFAAHMAWGPPAGLRQAGGEGRNVRFEMFIRCTSGPKAGDYVAKTLDCDGTSSEIQLAMENGLVTEIKYVD